MLSKMNLQVPFGRRKVALKFIVCNALVAFSVIVADICDQHVMIIVQYPKLEGLDCEDYIPIVRKPKGK